MRSNTAFLSNRLVLGLLSSYIGSVASFTATKLSLATTTSPRHFLIRKWMSTEPHVAVISSSASSSTTTTTTTTTTITTITPTTTSSSSSSSLASDYAILIRPPHGNELIWELHSLNQWEDSNHALCQLSETHNNNDYFTRDEAISPVLALSCHWSLSDSRHDLNNYGIATFWSIEVVAHDVVAGEVDAITTVPLELMCILSRIMVQSAATLIAKHTKERKDTILLRITLQLLDGSRVCQQMLLSNLCNNGDAGVRFLFAPLNSQYADMELVDMVNGEGLVLGALPRPYIHTWNILHRGSGILVSKDKDVFQSVKEGKDLLPHQLLYVHQRTSSKRIFPSLFDMFVGGVSCHGEDSRLTAAREVAEELGLTRALIMLKNKQRQQDAHDEEEKDQLNNPLSEKIFQCTICTSYNRCVVSVYTFTTCDADRISWQEEEVAWGDYVPYAIVDQAAASSINRLVESRVWPEKERIRLDDTKSSIGGEQLIVNSGPTSDYCAADTWDFVPDGLLVWKAWNSFLSGYIISNPSSLL